MANGQGRRPRIQVGSPPQSASPGEGRTTPATSRAHARYPAATRLHRSSTVNRCHRASPASQASVTSHSPESLASSPSMKCTPDRSPGAWGCRLLSSRRVPTARPEFSSTSNVALAHCHARPHSEQSQSPTATTRRVPDRGHSGTSSTRPSMTSDSPTRYSRLLLSYSVRSSFVWMSPSGSARQRRHRRRPARLTTIPICAHIPTQQRHSPADAPQHNLQSRE
jgi:hypothetical protein